MAMKSVLFDLDGTLTDSGEGIINCAALALEHFGLPVPSREEMRVFVGPPLHDTLVKFGVPEDKAEVIACKDSRAFLAALGIDGEIVPTPSHSEDSITLVLDIGDCFVGDLEPMEFMDGYEENKALQSDWEKVMSFSPKVIHYGHAPERRFSYE